MARIAKVAGVDELAIKGFIVAVWMNDGSLVLGHSACCTAHARETLVQLSNRELTQLVPCSDEQ